MPIVIVVLISISVLSTPAPAAESKASVATPKRAKPALPEVPVKYVGDTDKTIIRRAEWIEAAKKEGGMAWWGTFTPVEARKVVSEFNKIYPFIKVDYWRGGAIEVATKLEAEVTGGRYNVDICNGPEPFHIARWRGMGVLAKFIDIIPGIDKINKQMYSKYGDWIMPGLIGMTPQYNTKLVTTAEAPKSWEDLLDPKWKGQLGMPVDMKGWTRLAVGEGGWGIEKTEKFLSKIKEQMPIWSGSNLAANALLATGETRVLGSGHIRHVYLNIEKGAPVQWVRANPVVVTGSNWVLVQKAPHPNAARLWVEWLFSPQGLATFEKITYYGPAVGESRLAKDLKGLDLVYSTEEGDLKITEMDLEKKFYEIVGVK